MGQSRNANRAWASAADGTVATPFIGDAARGTRERRGARPLPAHGSGLHPSSDAFRNACRMFPGFELVPAAFRATLDPYASYFDADSGPLSLHERTVIARAVSGRDEHVFGAASDVFPPPAIGGPDVPEAGDEPAEAEAHDPALDALIAAFAVKVTRRWLAIGGGDVERLLDAGVSARRIRAIVETAAVFHFLAALSAAMLLRPRLPAGRARVAAVAGRDPSWRELSRWLA
jgi:hypothetical protein